MLDNHERYPGHGKPVVVTKRGTPMVKVVPVETKKSNLFGFMAGEFKVIGDTEPPVVPLKHWEILQKWSCSTRTF